MHACSVISVTLRIVVCQALQSVGSSWQEYWSGLPFPPQGYLPNPRIKPTFPEAPALAGIFFFFLTTEPPGNSMKKQKDMTLKNEFPRSVGAPYATGEITPERMKKQPKRKQHPVVDVTGDGSEVRCCKEQYCIGTWNVRSLNQGKLKVGKQAMARINIDVLGISELQ